jgi:Arc/MetJ family transcription regulator
MLCSRRPAPPADPLPEHQMQPLLASRCMPRTTIDIDASVLFELKRRQRSEKRPLGELASELLAEALAGRAAEREQAALGGANRWVRALTSMTRKRSGGRSRARGDRPEPDDDQRPDMGRDDGCDDQCGPVARPLQGMPYKGDERQRRGCRPLSSQRRASNGGRRVRADRGDAPFVRVRPCGRRWLDLFDFFSRSAGRSQPSGVARHPSGCRPSRRGDSNPGPLHYESHGGIAFLLLSGICGGLTCPQMG